MRALANCCEHLDISRAELLPKVVCDFDATQSLTHGKGVLQKNQTLPYSQICVLRIVNYFYLALASGL
jgi:hypothetical protein